MTSPGVFAAPQAKNVVLYKNGDPFFTGRKFVVNQRQILTFETFLNEVTSNINAPVAVRKIYTPGEGHRVLELNDLQNGCHYVAAGFEKFKKLDYLQNGNKKPDGNRRKHNLMVRIVYPYRGHTSARWSKYIQMPCIINIFRNGDLLTAPFRLVIPKHVMSDWDTILAMVTEKANLRTGAARRLYTLDGSVIDRGTKLESGQYYVGVGSEKFKHLPYLELLGDKIPSRNTHRHHQVIRIQHKNSNKEEPNHRRVQSTGNAGKAGIIVSPRMVVKRDTNASSQNHSVFYTKPVTVWTHRKFTKISQARAATTENGSVFKVNEKRAELQGAHEIPDDENTKVELPIDQRVAEIVQDEVIHEARPGNVKEKLGTSWIRLIHQQ
ncbi:doublecortin domain-containing protein 2B isoform X1 [Callorhinchus milii]|uniref:doublecortin domain-containing protein 2B isoform X1 n=1 Tax=Callorhinchus milii TaxID=7868 RepID=UPI001C3F91BD|nr:doublecortin domain-containing protein 2B isoform X1 [Callorhinchus milii]